MYDSSDSALLNQKLLQSEFKLRQFFAAIPDLVFVISLSGSIEFVPTQISLSDAQNQLIIEAITNQFFSDENDNIWLNLARSVILSQAVKSHEYKLVFPGDITNWFMASIAPLSSDEVVCIIRNITDLKCHEIQLAEAKEAAEQANRSKTIFLQNISHELRNPLNAMIGFAQIIKEQSQTSVADSKYLTYILSNSNYLLAMVNQLLDLAQIESDVLHTTLNLCHTRSFAQEIMDQFLEEANQKQLDLILNIDLNVPQWIYIDALKVRQILQNLIHNAVKFTLRGSITLELIYQVQIDLNQAEKIWQFEALSKDQEYLSNDSNEQKLHGEQLEQYQNTLQLPLDFNAWLCVVVTDTGVGILPEEKSIIWQPFNQGQAGKDSYQGVGLGLAIFHRFVKHLGAQIFFESEVGVGTKFTILLPIKTTNVTISPDQELDQLVNPYLNLFPINIADHSQSMPAQSTKSTQSNQVTSNQDNQSNSNLNSDPNVTNLNQIHLDCLYTMQQLALQADFNGLRSLCNQLETEFPQFITVISSMVEQFAYEELLIMIENVIKDVLNSNESDID